MNKTRFNYHSILTTCMALALCLIFAAPGWAEWVTFITAKKAEELDRIIEDENLNVDETKAFVGNAFRDGAIPVTGTAITKILPPVSRFNKDNGHAIKKQTVLDKLGAFFERFFGLV